METVQLELELNLEQPGLGLPAAAPHPGTPEGLTIDQNRVYLLELLYQADGRNDPSHLRHGTYTGLAEAFHQRLGRALVDEALRAPDMTAVLDVFELAGPGA
jgi:hypothetical protein